VLSVVALLVLAPHSGAESSKSSGTIVFSASSPVCDSPPCGGSDIYTVDSSGKAFHRRTRGLGARLPSISPGGSQIAFVRGRWLGVKTFSRPGYRIIFKPKYGETWESSWSPDGTWIVFAGYKGTAGLFLIRPDGTGLHSIVTELGNGQWPRSPSWSPDGRWIAYSSGRSPAIWLAHPNGTGLHSVPNAAGASYPTWSPDGRLLAFFSDDTVVVIRPDGSGRRVVAQDVYTAGYGGPHFSPDGKSLVFTRYQQRESIWIDALDGTRKRRLPLPTFVFWGIDWSRPPARTLVSAVQRMAPLKASGAKISASLNRTKFLPGESTSVTLKYQFSNQAHLSRTFSLTLERRLSGKWRTVRKVVRTGAFHGGPYYRTVFRLFKYKSIRVGKYRLRLSADANSVLLGFEIVAGEPLLGAFSISAGGFHSCAALDFGTVRCWGKNSLGQLGNGTFTDSAAAVQVQGILDATAVSSGENHSCALLWDGAIECWGNNQVGELGSGTMTNTTAPFGLATPVPVSGIKNAVAVSAGWNHTCAVLSDGTIECWGANSNGQLGNGTTTSSPTPVQVSGITNAVAVSAGASDTCALLSDSTVSCWGWNGMGALGNGTTVDSSIPVPISGLSDVESISAGGYTNCALRRTGTVDCWGSDIFGQLGNGTTSESPEPVTLSQISGAAEISAGGFFACARLSEGGIDCWGRNTEGELGNGTTLTSGIVPLPVQVAGVSAAAAISAGGDHACALLPGGAASCWGGNDFGQLGNGAKISSSTPVGVLRIE